MKDMTLLVADDEVINFQYLEILLKNNVKKMDHAINGREAVEMASKAKYDMILMDLKMPGMDGFEATRRLKSNFPTIPIIAQTAYATMEDKEEATLAGCDDFIAKPIKKEILFEMIQKNL
jgi:CheY-like chemotaxis protein